MSDPKLEEMAREWLTERANCTAGTTFLSGRVYTSLEDLTELLEQAHREGAEEAEACILARDHSIGVLKSNLEAAEARVKELEASLRDMRGSRDANSEALAAERSAHERTRERIGGLRDTLFVARNTVGDLRNGFSIAIDPARWVVDMQEFMDEALRDEPGCDHSKGGIFVNGVCTSCGRPMPLVVPV